MIILFLTFYGMIEDIADAGMALRKLGHVVHNFSLLESLRNSNRNEWLDICKQYIESRQINILVWWCLPEIDEIARLRSQIPHLLFVFYPWDDIYAWNASFSPYFDIVLEARAYRKADIQWTKTKTFHSRDENKQTWITHDESQKIAYDQRIEKFRDQYYLFMNPTCFHRDIAYASVYGRSIQVIPEKSASWFADLTWKDWALQFVEEQTQVALVPNWVILLYEDVSHHRISYKEMIEEMRSRSFTETYIDFNGLSLL